MTSVSEGSSATLVIRRDLSLIPGCYTNSFEAATPGRIHEAPACPMDSYFAPWTVTSHGLWWRLDGAGHTVSSQIVLKDSTPVTGIQNRDIEFAEVAWAFFAARLSL